MAAEAMLMQTLAWQRHALPLEPDALTHAAAEAGERLLGERLFPLIHCLDRHLPGKVTGMLLEGLSGSELLELLIIMPLDDAVRAIASWVDAAHDVLQEAHATKGKGLREACDRHAAPPGGGGEHDGGATAAKAADGEWQLAKPRKRRPHHKAPPRH